MREQKGKYRRRKRLRDKKENVWRKKERKEGRKE